MDDETFYSTLSGHRNSPKVSRMLHVHIACGELRAARNWILVALTALGVPVWLAALQPALLPATVRRAAVDLWGGGGVLLGLAVLAEWWCRRWRARMMGELLGSSTQGGS
jgi:hypothetical protein